MAIQRQNHLFSMRMMEHHWNSDIKALRCRMEVLDQKISTISVGNLVVKVHGSSDSNKIESSRPFVHCE